VTIDMAGYLSISRTIDVVSADTPLGTMHMTAGDANRDETVNLFDLTIVASAFDTQHGGPGFDERADINGDGEVNLFDLVLISNNFDRSGPTDGTVNGSAAAKTEEGKQGKAGVAPAQARLVARAPKDRYLLGDLVTVALNLDNLTDFYGGSLDLAYDPKTLEVVDMDSNLPGTQVKPGDLFPAGSVFAPRENVTLNRAGQPVVRFAGARLGADPTGGQGTLVEVTFRVIGCGASSLDLSTADLKLSDRAGESLPVEGSGSIDTRAACLFLPLVQVGGQ